jgi:ADP-ribosyl-[dinitrogen reductase] hydrolase
MTCTRCGSLRMRQHASAPGKNRLEIDIPMTAMHMTPFAEPTDGAVTLSERYRGALLGLACGDALGAPVSFCKRGSFAPLTGMVGGGFFQLEPGQWTDDTSLAMCLAESLVECEDFDPADQLVRYARWFAKGHWSSRPHAFDVGKTTEAAITAFLATGELHGAPDDPGSAGNGSIMRLAPVALRYYPSLDDVVRFAAESSRTTHRAAECVDACRVLGFALCKLLAGADRATFLDGAAAVAQTPRLARIAAGSFLRKPRSRISSSGYCVHSLEAALWCFCRSDSFEEALLLAANLGNDADTVSAITGQLAGAHHGVRAIPPGWLATLHRKQDIAFLANCLLQLARRGHRAQNERAVPGAP